MARSENALEDNLPAGLAALVQRMRKLRAGAGLTIAQLADRCHYSSSSLSVAASGKALPKWEIVEAFVKGCDPDAEMGLWRTWWEMAQQSVMEESSAAAPSQAVGEHDDESPPGRSRFERRNRESHRGELLALVKEATTDEGVRVNALEANRPVDQVRIALALCTLPEDFVALLRELLDDRGMSPRELADEAARLGLTLGRATVQQMIQGN
ncbi:helix-turn-helix domain-containing protein [Streptomyces sp. 8N706]|uniref:helix-turn-helix domain-containing protein n=1 Tax=Streptomyces sp. 8N706 TaxID=3457416 RepID=UPI003FD0DD30